jgi:glycosyltransferase involved in cell wall biosynthesis
MSDGQVKDIFIIMPAYNEEKDIIPVLQEIIHYAKKIIVVDDGSTDKTAETVRRVSANITVVQHDINLGKGAALRTGCDTAIDMGAKYLLLMDADGQHSVSDMKKIADKIIDNNFDIVFGERKFNDKMPIMMKLGNNFLTFLINGLFNIKLSDTQCGLRAFTDEAYKKIRWQKNDYSVETEMLIKAGNEKLNYSSVGIDTIYKDKYKGTGIKDGVIILFSLLKWKFFDFN